MTASPPRPSGALAHPDALLLSRASAALAWWAGHRPPTPTSSVTGGGAIAAVEDAVGRLSGGRPAVALPNATYGLRVALQAVGVRCGDEVLVAALDWPAAAAAVHSLGAHPVAVNVDELTLTVDPAAAAAARTRRTAAVVVTHLHGVCADVPALRDALGETLPVVEDAAQAFGATLGGRPAGALGDVAVFSFGPGKPIDAGELAVLVARDEALCDAAVRASQHPVRQRLHGIVDPDLTVLAGRAAPLSALVAAHELHRWPQRSAVLRAGEAVLRPRPGDAGDRAVPLAVPPARAAVPGVVPVRVGESWKPPADVVVRRSGACPVLPTAGAAAERLRSLADRVRLLVVGDGTTDPSPEHGT